MNCALQKTEAPEGLSIQQSRFAKFKPLMKDYQLKFLDSHHGKSVDDLWSDFTSTIDSVATQCIPSKQILSKPSLPWITQQIRRLIRRRDDLYRKFKNAGDQTCQDKVLSLWKNIKHKMKVSYQNFLKRSSWA